MNDKLYSPVIWFLPSNCNTNWSFLGDFNYDWVLNYWQNHLVNRISLKTATRINYKGVYPICNVLSLNSKLWFRCLLARTIQQSIWYLIYFMSYAYIPFNIWQGNQFSNKLFLKKFIDTFTTDVIHFARTSHRHVHEQNYFHSFYRHCDATFA